MVIDVIEIRVVVENKNEGSRDVTKVGLSIEVVR